MMRFFTRKSAYKIGFIGAFAILASTFFQYFLKYTIIELNTFLTDRIAGSVITVGIFMIIIAIFIYTAAYLEIFGPDTAKAENKLDTLKAVYDEQIKILQERLNEIPPSKTDAQIEISVSKVFETRIKNKIEEKMATGAADIAKETLLKSYAPAIYKDNSYKNATSIYENSIRGMQERMRNQEINAKVSLTYGVGFALAGLGALAFFVMQPYFSGALLLRSGNSTPDWNSFLIDFIPRLSFVLIFESIAFFFLKTYRDDNAMIRYFRNEITNVEEKALALFSAVLFADDKTISNSISKMMTTERNFIVKKGQRTISEVTMGGDEIMIEKVVDRLTSALADNRLVKKENPKIQTD